jgi:hypothetical protein
MATAEIAQSFDTDGNCMTLTLTVTGDVLDSAEILDECVKRAAILWHVVEAAEDEADS